MIPTIDHPSSPRRALAMTRGTLSRRGFWGASLASMTLGAGLPGWFARELIAGEQATKPRRIGPNDRLAIGAIGVGGQGARVMTEAVGKRRDVALVAACVQTAAALRPAEPLLARERVEVQFGGHTAGRRAYKGDKEQGGLRGHRKGRSKHTK